MKLIYIFLSVIITNAFVQQVSSQNIYNVVGGVSNGLRIKNAYIGVRAIMTVDKDNNIIASATDHTMYDIRKYDLKNDIVQTIAGNDSFGPFIEGGKALQTCLVESVLDQPTSVMMDDYGNIYMADGDPAVKLFITLKS